MCVRVYTKIYILYYNILKKYLSGQTHRYDPLCGQACQANRTQIRAVGRCLRSSDKKSEREEERWGELSKRIFIGQKSTNVEAEAVSPPPLRHRSRLVDVVIVSRDARSRPVQRKKKTRLKTRASCEFPRVKRSDATTRPCGVVGSARALLPRASFRAARTTR